MILTNFQVSYRKVWSPSLESHFLFVAFFFFFKSQNALEGILTQQKRYQKRYRSQEKSIGAPLYQKLKNHRGEHEGKITSKTVFIKSFDFLNVSLMFLKFS